MTSIGDRAFYNCSSLPVENDIRYADTYLIEVTNKEKSTYKIKEGTRFIGPSAFANCENLSSITIPNSVISIGNYAFDRCSSLTNIHIDDISSWIKTEGVGNVTGNMKHLFVNGEEITSITIASDVEKIGNGTFSGLPINLSSG